MTQISPEAIREAFERWRDFEDVHRLEEGPGDSERQLELGHAFARLRANAGLDDEAIRVFYSEIDRDAAAVNAAMELGLPGEEIRAGAARLGLIIGLTARSIQDEHDAR